MERKYIQRNYGITKRHDIIVKKVAKKMKISEAEVIRRRIKPFDEMLKELTEDMKFAEFINLENIK